MEELLFGTQTFGALFTGFDVLEDMPLQCSPFANNVALTHNFQRSIVPTTCKLCGNLVIRGVCCSKVNYYSLTFLSSANLLHFIGVVTIKLSNIGNSFKTEFKLGHQQLGIVCVQTWFRFGAEFYCRKFKFAIVCQTCQSNKA